MEKKGKLELTWVGKYEEEKLEPRILIEDKSKSYGDPNTENMLIHGDNLLALKALEDKYTGSDLFLQGGALQVRRICNHRRLADRKSTRLNSSH